MRSRDLGDPSWPPAQDFLNQAGTCERARRILITFRDPGSLPQAFAGGCQDAVLMPGAGSGIRQDMEIGGRPGFGVGAHRRHALLEDRAAPGR